MIEAKRRALWSPEALDDREKIWDYYFGIAGQHTAEKVSSIRRARAKRSAPRVALHVVFYRVLNDTPEIVRVLDGRQDIEEKFATHKEG